MNFIKNEDLLSRRKEPSVEEDLIDDKLKNDSKEKALSNKAVILKYAIHTLHLVYAFAMVGIILSIVVEEGFLIDDKLKGDSTEISLSNKEVVLKYTIHSLHMVYALAMVGIVLQTVARVKKQKLSMQILSLSIAVPLVLDNLRLGVPALSNQIHLILSKICFFAHEVITPFSLIYVAQCIAVLTDSSIKKITISQLQQQEVSMVITITAIISSGLSFLGLQRFLSYSGWHMVPVNGILVCRPANPSHAALVPIFLTVGGLVLVSGWAHFILRRQNDEQWMTLFLSQVVVFVGNGIVGPSKVLNGLFANAFEVLWLWSIVSIID